MHACPRAIFLPQRFERIDEVTTETTVYTVEVSYYEIYQEHIADLLTTSKHPKHNLRVRNHTILGPYVEGLQKLAVSQFNDVKLLMDKGTSHRTIAATKMNATSSRSHAVFTLTLTENCKDPATQNVTCKVSKLSLVDLAGSERQSKTGAVGATLHEGALINKSLSTLGKVIKALADDSKAAAHHKHHDQKKKIFVPYRESVLTWLLKDNLGGNSKTLMMAAISPSADNYDETLSTLRYASSAKQIVNHAVVNEDPNARMLRDLRSELEKVRLAEADAARTSSEKALRRKSTEFKAMQDHLRETDELMKQMSMTWGDKLKVRIPLLCIALHVLT